MEQGKPEAKANADTAEAGKAEPAKAKPAKSKKMRTIPITEIPKEKPKETVKEKVKEKKTAAQTHAENTEQSQAMLNNIITGIQNMSRDPAMFALMNGMSDDLLDRDEPTVIPSGLEDDIDYIIIPI